MCPGELLQGRLLRSQGMGPSDRAGNDELRKVQELHDEHKRTQTSSQSLIESSKYADDCTNSCPDPITNSRSDPITNSRSDPITNSRSNPITNSRSDPITFCIDTESKNLQDTLAKPDINGEEILSTPKSITYRKSFIVPN